MVWNEALEIALGAVWAALWISLPPVLGAAAAGICAGFIQRLVGMADGHFCTFFRFLGGVLGFLWFGAWMLAFMTRYWLDLWNAVPELAR